MADARLSGSPVFRKRKGRKPEWVQDYYDAHGKRRQATGASAAEAAQKALDKIALSHEQAPDTAPKPEKKKKEITVSDVLDQYIDACARGRDGKVPLTHDTIRSYRQRVDKWIKPELGDIPVKSLRRVRIEQFRDDLLATGGNRTTLNKPLTMLNMALNHAVHKEVIPANPGYGIAIAQDWDAVAEFQEAKIPSLADMRTLEETAHACYTSDKPMVWRAYRRYYPLFLILRLTGMRISECLGLQWDDFDKDFTTVKVQRRVSVPREGLTQEERIGRNKSKNSRREIPLPAEIVPVLKTWKGECLETERGWLFPTCHGNPASYANVWGKFWLPLVKRAGLEDFTMHGLRHFYASSLMRKGLVKQASMYLGHSSVAFTMDVYGHLIPKDAEMIRAVTSALTEGMEV